MNDEPQHTQNYDIGGEMEPPKEPTGLLAQSELAQPDTPKAEFSCPKCHRPFPSPQSLRMHDMRVHSRKLGHGYKWKQRPPQTREKQIITRREYSRGLRARWYAEGKDSHGRVRPPGWKPRQRQGLFKIGSKWTPERRAKFSATMRRKAREAGKVFRKKSGKKFQPFVYPIPVPDSELTRQQENERRIQDEGESQLVNIPTLKHCPNCGEHLAGWKYQP